MAPRAANRVRIVSPNSGSVCYSRSVSLQHDNNSNSGSDDDGASQLFYRAQNQRVRGRAGTDSYSHSHQRSTSASSSILKKNSSFGRAPLAALPHNRQSNSRSQPAKSFSRSASAPVRSAADIEALYGSDGRRAPHSQRRSRTQREVEEEEEDERAIERAQEALNVAASCVLRRPFGQQKNTVPAPSAAESKDRTAGARHLSVPPPLPGKTSRSTSRATAAATAAATTTAAGGRNLQLPRTIPVTRSRSSHASSADFNDLLGDEDKPSMQPLKRRRREERQPAMPAYMSALIKTHKPSGPSAGGKVSQSATAPHPPTTAAAPVSRTRAGGPCPGMFSGLSSIAMNDKLFEGAFQARDDQDADAYTLVGTTSSTTSSSTASSARAGVAAPFRRCSRPLWCLVGTFKTGLSSVVSVDPTHDRLYWQQRNPRGGFQSIRVPLSCLLDAFVARVTQEDEGIQEQQFTVVIRTSTRPSQVVFGFRTSTEANQFVRFLAPMKPSA